MSTSDLSPLAAREHDALEAITALLTAGRRVIVAYSGGKDSTAVLLMVLNAARALAECGVNFPGIVITHGDTGIENPAVVGLVHNELRKARAFGERHGFPVEAAIAHPSLNDSWAVAVLSGRKLPTFVSSGTRDCTIMFKVKPMTRLRNKLLKAERTRDDAKKPVTLTGTRFEESESRAARMLARGETAYATWVKDGEWFLSPICDWDMGDVWEYLGWYRNGSREGFTDARDVFDMYASATDENTCAVVGDLASEETKKKRACGARFGCSLCAAVGRDKSLEAMLQAPDNAWLRPLNAIQRFIVDTQHDWSRRNWIGRTLIDGYIEICPDTYSPAMVAELLRYCLSADADEARAARRLGVAPRFQLVSYEQMLAIDALWSLHGIQARPFAALAIWHEVHEQGRRFYPPELTPAARTPRPAPRYLQVGEGWDGEAGRMFSGFRDVLYEEFGDEGCIGTRELADGRVVADVTDAPSFSFDPEAMELFAQFEAEYVLERHHADPHSTCRAGIMHYVHLGMLATSNKHVQEHLDRILRRTAWKQRHGLVGTIDLEALLSKTISKAELRALAAAPNGLAAASLLQANPAPAQLDLWAAEQPRPATSDTVAPRVPFAVVVRTAGRPRPVTETVAA